MDSVLCQTRILESDTLIENRGSPGGAPCPLLGSVSQPLWESPLRQGTPPESKPNAPNGSWSDMGIPHVTCGPPGGSAHHVQCLFPPSSVWQAVGMVGTHSSALSHAAVGTFWPQLSLELGFVRCFRSLGWCSLGRKMGSRTGGLFCFSLV